MAKTEDSGKDVSDFFDKLVPALTIRSGMWGTSLGRKANGFLDGQGRKMNVVFGGVLNVTAVVSSDVLWSERIVVDETLDIVVGIALVCEHLEESRASRTGAT